MADKEVGLSLKVNGDQAEKAVKSFKSQLREAQNDLTSIVDKFGATSVEATKAAKRVAELRDAIGDAKDLAAAFNPDKKFEAFSGALRGVTGGFAALQGAIGLTGTESEDLNKQLLKVQSALALSEGLNSITSAKDSFKNLAAVIKTQVVSSFSTLKAAIISTGIGALVVGLGLLIANFDAVKEAVLKAVPGLATVGKFLGNIVQKITDFVGVTSQASRALEELKKANDAANSSLDSTIKILEAQGGREDEVYKLKRQRIENERKGLVDQLKAKGDLNDKEREQLLKLNTDLSVLDASETARRSKVAEERKKKDEQLAKEREAEQDARREREYQKELEAQNRELKLIEERQKARLSGQTGTINQDELSQAEQEKRDAEVEAEQKKNAKIQESQQALLANRKGALVEEAAAIKATAEANIAIAEKEAAAKAAALQATTTALTNLSVIAGKDTVAGKALAIAAATINTYQGITASLKAGGFLGISQAIAVGAAGFAAVKNIIATPLPSVPGVSGGSGGQSPSLSPVQSPIQPTISSRAIEQFNLNQQGNAANRAYVLDRDISNNQERERRLSRAAKLG